MLIAVLPVSAMEMSVFYYPDKKQLLVRDGHCYDDSVYVLFEKVDFDLANTMAGCIKEVKIV